MPPKQGAAGGKPSKKTEQKKKEKVIEDKTFGLKNKKGAKQQKFIQQVQKQVHYGGTPSARKLELEKEKEKQQKLAAAGGPSAADALLFKPVQKVDKNADPKSILCAFFKQGNCGKGDRCKFSHDLAVERRAEKKNLYTDSRDGEPAAEDSMENWDEAKLAEVVEKKHGGSNRQKENKTDIICKYFLDAVEKQKYGWFWECPNGGASCMYRHALPPGFVLKRDEKKLKEQQQEQSISLEDWIETERAKLVNPDKLTKLTLETFLRWKKRKLLEKRRRGQEEERKKREKFEKGHRTGMSGREMFTFDPEMLNADDEEATDTGHLPAVDSDDGLQEQLEEEEVDNNQYKELELEAMLDELHLDQIDEALFDEDDELAL